MESINTRIKNEICHDTLNEISDEKLLPVYKECESLKKAITELEKVLDKFVEHEIKENIVNDYLLNLIPPGTKGVIRGNKFNEIIKKHITNLNMDKSRFKIAFEKRCEGHLTTEIPDWYILEKPTNKIIIGMNQLDLWGGGQQLNRGSKYLVNNKHNTENSKLLCVVCNHTEFKSIKSKAYNLFEIGFKNNTLCYIKNLENIIKEYFD